MQGIAAHDDLFRWCIRQGLLDQLIDFGEGFAEEANIAKAPINQQVAKVTRLQRKAVVSWCYKIGIRDDDGAVPGRK